MLTGLDGILLGRKAKSIITHRMQDIEALQPLVAGVYVACYISQRMAHMQPRT